MFSLHYWDWRDPNQRDALFTENRLGKNEDGVVVGTLFENWSTVCWKDHNSTTIIPICDPTEQTDTLRRCPIESACHKGNADWPTFGNVKSAVAKNDYDASPYNKFVTGEDASFRNFMEGFVTQPESSCGDDAMCTEENDCAIRRKLHNSVSTRLDTCKGRPGGKKVQLYM